MADKSVARPTTLTCRCGSAIPHEHWDVIDEAERPELMSALAEGVLQRVECRSCGRTVFVEEPIALLRADATTPLVLLFTDHEPDPDGIPLSGCLPVMWAPASAPPYLVGRDLDADVAAPDAARADVECRFGPAAALVFAETLRHFAVVTDPLHVLPVFEQLLGTDLPGFQSLLADRPELTSDAVQRSTERIASVFPEQTATLRAMGQLFTEATDDPQAAWTSFQEAMARIGHDFDEVMPEYDRLVVAYQAARLEEVILLGPPIVERCHDIGAFLAEGHASEVLALALLQHPSEDRPGRVEEAVRLFTRAADRAGDDRAARAVRLSELATAYEQRLRGDRRSNTDRAIDLLATAIRELGTADPDLLAGLETNLAFALTQRETDDPLDDLIQAYDLCQSALAWRTPERDANDWAYTQVNLGAVLGRLADHGRARRRDARRAYASILSHVQQIDAQVATTAQTNLARLDRMDRALTRSGRRRRLRATREQLSHHVDELKGGGPVARGRALHELALLDLELGHRADAITRLERAADLLRPELSPTDCTDVTTTLAPLLADDGEWSRAATAFSDAVAASDMRFYERTTAGDREREVRSRGNLSRWASYVVARAGDTRRAVVLLEDGRTRELRLRMGADDEQLSALRRIAPKLHDAYLQALADLAGAQLADDADVAALRYQRTLEQVRAVHGLAQFGGPMTFDAVTAAANGRQPLVYINSAPWGTAILTIGADGTAGARFLKITSTTVMQRLMLGLDDRGHQTPPAYLATASHDASEIDLALALALPWVGEALAAPIGDELRAAGARAATLVPCGLLAAFPIHVAPQSPGTAGSKTLADEFDITFAPSAALHAAAHRRAAQRDHTRETATLVAVADPTSDDPLPASRAEVADISSRFSPNRRHVASGDKATSEFLRHHAAHATYLHLACHAFGAIFDFRDSHLRLADGNLPLTELSRIGPLTSRLAVASACQTALPDTALSDEAYSVSAILLTAGAASAIASLWPVDDVATALLMAKLYEAHLAHDLRPSEALRSAQMWLRGLERNDAEAMIAASPTLAAEATRRAEAGEHLLPDGARPFADPGYWAAFVAMGA